MITAENIRDIFSFDPDTGTFVWVNDHPFKRYRAGDVAGCAIPNKRRSGQKVRIQYKGKNYAAHRIAWLYVHGVWPPELVDHINGDPFDNRIANLRLASPSQNQANRCRTKPPRSGFIGVAKLRNCRSWTALIRHGGKTTYLGSFATPEEASVVYLAAHQALYKEFSAIRLKEETGSNRANGLPSV